MSAEGGDISVQEAKARLLAWSEQADVEVHQELRAALATAKRGALATLPWAAGAALLMGLLTGRRKRDKESGHAGSGGAGGIGKLIGAARTAIRVATFALPLVRAFLASRRPSRE
jgi:hypothetical protein